MPRGQGGGCGAGVLTAGWLTAPIQTWPALECRRARSSRKALVRESWIEAKRPRKHRAQVYCRDTAVTGGHWCPHPDAPPTPPHPIPPAHGGSFGSGRRRRSGGRWRCLACWGHRVPACHWPPGTRCTPRAPPALSHPPRPPPQGWQELGTPAVSPRHQGCPQDVPTGRWGVGGHSPERLTGTVPSKARAISRQGRMARGHRGHHWHPWEIPQPRHPRPA